MVKLLADNGAKLSSGDAGNFACFAIEQNSLDLLKDIVHHGGDVTLLNSLGTTALHTAISEDNTEIVKFLVDQGADIDKPDVHGWTPRALADFQGHETIKALFETMKETSNQPVAVVPKKQGVPFLSKHRSEPTMPIFRPEIAAPIDVGEATSSSDHRRQRRDNFPNSLVGIMLAAN